MSLFTPSTILNELPAGIFSSRCTFPDGHRISIQSTDLSWPIPTDMRLSWWARKPFPPDLTRVWIPVEVFIRTIVPNASLPLWFPSRVKRIERFFLTYVVSVKKVSILLNRRLEKIKISVIVKIGHHTGTAIQN